jgi:hypothetical protein
VIDFTVRAVEGSSQFLMKEIYKILEYCAWQGGTQVQLGLIRSKYLPSFPSKNRLLDLIIMVVGFKLSVLFHFS